MRKALMTMILAATAMVPAAAGAQDWHNRGDRGGHTQNQNESDNNGNNGNGRHSESRHEERQVQQQQQPQVQVQQVPAVQNNNRGNWRGNDGNGGGGSSNGGRTGGGNGGGDRHNWRDGDNNRTSSYPQAWQGDPNDPRLRHYRELEQRNQNGGRNDWRDNRNDRNDRGDWRNDDRNGPGGNDWRGDRNGRNGHNDWNRNWRNDNRFDWNGWRYRNRSIFHLSPYYAPYRNWGYRRFSIGFFLEPLFFDQRYWIGDPYDYRLPPAPPGTQWVRYYNDVVLVDIYSGEIVDVIYDFFW